MVRDPQSSTSESHVDDPGAAPHVPEPINEQFRTFIDSNIVAIHRSDIYGNLYEVNDATIELLGYSREEFESGRVKWHEITPKEYLHLDERAIEEIRATGMARPWEKEYIRSDGSRVQVLIGVVAADTTGDDCFAFLIDISERKRLEEQLRINEARFRMLAEALPQMVWIADDSGRTSYCNERFYRYTGIKREEDDGWAWLGTVHPDDRDLCLSEGARARQGRTQFSLELRYRNSQGNYRWQLVRAIPLESPETGIFSWFGTCTDIDDKRQQEEELKESETRFRTLADAIPQIVFCATPQGDIDFFNERWFEYTGLTLAESQNQAWRFLIHPDDLKEYTDGWNRALKYGDTYETEFRLRRAPRLGETADYRWHMFRAVAQRTAATDGSVARWFCTWTEIDHQKKKQGRN